MSDAAERQQSRDRYRAFIDVLHKNDVDKYIDLPQIAVIGDTSTGKSSLLTAVSGIQFPCAAELTTRCPARVRLEESSDECVKVYVKWTVDKSKAVWPVQTFSPNQTREISAAIAEAQKAIVEQSTNGFSTDIHHRD